MNKSIVYICLVILGLGLPTFVPGQDRTEKDVIKAIQDGDIASFTSYMERRPGWDFVFSNGYTGLYYAIVHDRFDIAKYLLDRGADPDLVVRKRSTLKWAIRHDRGRMARLLIEFGASVNMPDKKLETPLMYAAKLDNLEMCKILFNRGADPLAITLRGKTAADFARYHTELATHNYLLKAEAHFKDMNTVISMHDGPYIFWETDNRIVHTCFERDSEKNLTRLVEKTIVMDNADTLAESICGEKMLYHIQRDFFPGPFEIKTSADIFAIGDIHGRYDALVNLLKNNKIIDAELKWMFGNGRLVLLGDVFDRGDQVTETLWFLYELERQAQQSGGNVDLLLGNHEIMSLTGDHRYINGKYHFFTEFTQIPYYQLFEKNTILGRWLRSKNVIMRFNDYLFVHAGISPQLVIHPFDYYDINSRVRSHLNSDDYSLVKGSPEEMILGAFGPLWYRGYGGYGAGFPEATQEFVDMYLEKKGLQRMIVGHNLQPEIISTFGGKIISVDVAIDESGGSAQGLLISGDNFFRCYSDGRKERLF
ncbi:MAG: ankyrin repeat domain-containing protein [Bacteroidales bacterium]